MQVSTQQLQQQLAQVQAKVNELAGQADLSSLRFNQQQQVLDQYRVSIYNLELRFDLLIKMLEERGTMAKDEFVKRWPLFLKNEVGVIGQDGKMEGNLKVTFYGK